MAIARAIVSDPTLLVCDEPTGDLDRKTADEILRLLQMLNREHGKTIVMVTHDPKAAEYARRHRAPRQGHAAVGAGLRHEIPAAALGRALPQEDAHRSSRCSRWSWPSCCSACCRRCSVAFESGADSADAKRLLTTARYSIIEPLPISYLRRIEQVPGVVGVAYADWFGAKYQNESNAFPVFAVDPAALPRRCTRSSPSPPAQREAFATTRTGAIAGQRLAERYGWKVGQKLPDQLGDPPQDRRRA